MMQLPSTWVASGGGACKPLRRSGKRLQYAAGKGRCRLRHCYAVGEGSLDLLFMEAGSGEELVEISSFVYCFVFRCELRFMLRYA